MAKEFIKARYYWTVVECVEEIRKQAEKCENFMRFTSLMSMISCWDG